MKFSIIGFNTELIYSWESIGKDTADAAASLSPQSIPINVVPIGSAIQTIVLIFVGAKFNQILIVIWYIKINFKY